jgi:glycosyltransferase involved in cell wall biosynthesis
VPRTILLVAHLAPPSPLSAARRTAGFAKYLGRRGHRVIVVTSKISGQGPIEGAQRVVRTRDLMASRFNWRAGAFDALQGQAGGAAPPPSPLEQVVVPDLALVTWMPFALPAALRVAEQERPDVVWTTGPPPSTNLIGRALQRRGIPWVADIRDGWRFERNHGDFPLGAQRALDAALERGLTRAADRVTAVTEPIARDARDRLGARHATAISTGCDLEVLFAGPLSDDERAQIEAPELAGMTRVLGSLDRATTLRLQRAVDTLLLITTGNPSESGQKLFEYLAADRPVLVIGDRTEAARIVTEAKAGSAAPMDDPGAIADALADLVHGRTDVSPDGIAQRFHYAALAAELEAELETAIAARSTLTNR